MRPQLIALLRWIGKHMFAPAVAAVAASIMFGTVMAPRLNAQSEQTAPALAQPGNDLAKTAKFEVVSIRQDKPSGNSREVARIVNRSDDGRFYATAITAKSLVQVAYDLLDLQIEDGPGWINSERFDVQALADDATNDQLRALSRDQAKLVKQRMLQALLADRFKLAVHQETKEASIYQLVVAKNGPKIQDVSKTGPVIPGGPAQHVEGVVAPRFSNTTMPFLANALSSFVGRMVVDKTGLTGRYYFSYQYSRESTSVPWRAWAGGVPVPAGGAGAGANGVSGGEPDSSGPSIFTALREQLGLELKPAKGPVPVLLIDHIEQPTPN